MDTGERSLELLNDLQVELRSLLTEQAALRKGNAESRATIKSLQKILSQRPPGETRTDEDSQASGGLCIVRGTAADSKTCIASDGHRADCAKGLSVPMQADVSPTFSLDLSHLSYAESLSPKSIPQPPSPVSPGSPRSPFSPRSPRSAVSTKSRTEPLRFYRPHSLPRRERSISISQKIQKKVPLIRQVLESRNFEVSVGLLILANTLIMACEMQYYGYDAGYVAKFPEFDKPAAELFFLPNAELVFEILERTFTTIFTVELIVRLLVFRCKLFAVPLNWIDVVSVLAGLLDWISTSRTIVNPMMARLLRLAKLARGLRLAKMSTVLDSLHLLLKCISASLVTLSWSVCLLLMLQCIAGMIISQLVRDVIMDPNGDPADRHKVFSYYGTFTRSQITMFEVHLANFAPACRVLVDYCGEWYAILFLAYRCLAGYAVLNVINAVFIQQTISIAQRDQDIMLRQKAKNTEAYAMNLRKLFNELDTSADGMISVGEMYAIKSKPELLTWMNALEIDTSDLIGLFELLDLNGDHSITFDEFLEASTRIKGQAKSVDVLTVLAKLKELTVKIDTLMPKFSRQSSPEDGGGMRHLTRQGSRENVGRAEPDPVKSNYFL